ncbi:protein borderless-like [Zerene cesonia]|uniref:protein borderless-like n=1 Tax=Zerene cesonia TaxID=33412 RepID=UPI0018E53A86|nr:protein borderless-like [Zerene cesonia]XP_038215077.1 protein borderless-like [Zerene cesonia]
MRAVAVLCVALALAPARARGSLLPLTAERLQASVGGYAVMNCHLDFPFGNEIPYHLQWDKDGESIFSWYSGDDAPRLADRWGGRVRRAEGAGLGGGAVNLTSVRETDAGLYRCLVTFPNRTPPARNNGTFYYLDVDGGNLIVTPPMNKTVMEGESAELECLPKSREWAVQWFHEDTSVAELAELAARALQAANGSLLLRHALSTDPGRYECRVAAPDGQRQSASAYLDVQYKAKVVYSPKERHLPYGKPASLDCHFSANPPLTNLRWEKDGFLFDPYNVPGVFYSRNGSLLFNKVDESHEGVYSCTPYNALGSGGPSGGVRVRVQRPPALAQRPSPLYLARLGQALTLPCSAALDPPHAPPTVAWTRKDGGSLPEGRYSVDDGNLTISEISEDDRGVYVCTVSNEADVLAVESELLIENVPPRAPYNLTALAAHDSIHLSWVPGHNGLDVEYNVWYRERTDSEWRTMKILSRGVTDATVVGLRPATQYELRVLSQDLIGDGLFSKPIFVTTLDVEVSEAVSALAAAATEPGTESGVEPGAEPGAEPSDVRELDVSVRLLDEGALVRWAPRAPARCALRWYREEPERTLLATAHTHHDYILVSEVEEGASYWARVECGSAWGGAALHVPQYGRMRGVALGVGVGALLLAALAAAALLLRRRLCAPAKRPR